jgi:hypothetical protein
MPSSIPAIKEQFDNRAKLPQSGMSTRQLNIRVKCSEEAPILTGHLLAEIVKAKLFGD